MADQQERAFQKQPTVFQNQKKIPGAKKAVLKRYTRTVGLGFKMPTEVRCRVELIPAYLDFDFCFFIHFNPLHQSLFKNTMKRSSHCCTFYDMSLAATYF